MCSSVQKISPDSKDKVQLQVVMHDGGASTFQFAHPKGRTAQQEDRESVKELLQQLLPQFRRKVSSELEVKNKYGVADYIVICCLFEREGENSNGYLSLGQ